MKTTVIYHRADYDGIFCREIARKFLPDAELIGWDYGDDTPDVPKDVRLYMLDISIGDTGLINQDGLMEHPNLIWIDHHKSAIEKYPATIPGYRIDGVAACRLAWQWFTVIQEAEAPVAPLAIRRGLPHKQDFIDRAVPEPWAVRLAGEYDVWDRRDSNCELFQHGLRSEELYSTTWDALLSVFTDKEANLTRLINQGRSLQYARTKENESIISAAGFTIQFEGLTFLACNHARYNSFLFTAGLKPEHDGCFGFAWRDGRWAVSLYHAPGKEHHDLSKIAVKYGGGGHRGACGFKTDSLPFLAAKPNK